MKKLTLEIEELKVESFGTDAGEPRRGTVLGRESIESGCDTNDVCCQANSVGDRCGTSAV